MKIGPLRIVWIVLILLAAFVVFVECIAEAGDRGEALPRPAYTPPPEVYRPAAFIQWADSSSNTWLPLS